AAEERPLVCVVDDVQWLDRSSAQVLAFVARRLAAEAGVLLFAEREPGGLEQLAGLPQLRVGGVPDSAPREAVRAGDQGAAGRARAHAHPRRDARQSARAAGASARVVAGTAGRRVRGPERRVAAGSHRSQLRTARAAAAGVRAAPTAAGCGGSDG